MPNWCTNILSLTGNRTSIDKFKQMATSGEEGVFKFQNLIPMPTDKERQLEESKECYLRKFTTPGQEENSLEDAWYHWRVHNWGTKWDLDEEAVQEILEDENCLILEFDTAWSPPVPLVEAICKLFPQLEFQLEYYELGNFFAGHAVFERGMMMKHEEGTPEDFAFCVEQAEEMLDVNGE